MHCLMKYKLRSIILNDPQDASEQNELVALEERLTFEQSLLFREIAFKELSQERLQHLQHEARMKQEQSQRGYWASMCTLASVRLDVPVCVRGCA